MSNENAILDPRAAKIQTVAKVAGTGIVVAAASAVVVVAGSSLIVAAGVATVGLFMVNFVVPIAARSIALWRQNAITSLTEKFSEETIREDEQKEHERIKQLEQSYVTSRSELEGAQEELEKQMKQASAEEKEMLQQQVTALQTVIDEAEDTLKVRKADFVELQRVNKLYIALHRSASAMQKASGGERNSDELQRLEIARTSIKTKMRAAMAGKTIDSMNLAAKKAPSMIDAASVVDSRRKGHTSV